MDGVPDVSTRRVVTVTKDVQQGKPWAGMARELRRLASTVDMGLYNEVSIERDDPVVVFDGHIGMPPSHVEHVVRVVLTRREVTPS